MISSGTMGEVEAAARVGTSRQVLKPSARLCRVGLQHCVYSAVYSARRRAGKCCGGRSEAGSASIWMLGFAMVAWVTVAAVVVAASAMTARHRAATAADLSALAGASALAQAMEQELLTGTDPPPKPPPTSPAAPSLTPARLAAIACSAANSMATANGAQLMSCTVDGSTLAVEAAVVLPRLARWAQEGGIGSGSVSARARAGPS